MWSNSCWWMYAKFQMDFLKTTDFCHFDFPERPLFMLFQRILTSYLHFFQFGLFEQFSHFLRSLWKSGLKTCISPLNKPKIYIGINFFDHVTSYDLGLTWDRQRLRRLFRSIPDDPCRFIGFVSAWHGYFAQWSQWWQSKPGLWPDLWHHQRHTDKILLYIRKVHARGYQIPFSDRESVKYCVR